MRNFLLAILLVSLSSLGWGTQALVHSSYTNAGAAGCNSTSGTLCTFTVSATAPGNLLVVGLALNTAGGTITGMHSGQVGTWAIPANCAGASAGHAYCWAYCLSAPAGMTSITIDVSVSGDIRGFWYWELSNGLTWVLHDAPAAVRDATAGTSQVGVAFASMSGLNCAAFQANFTDTGGLTTAITGGYTLDGAGTTPRTGAHLLNTATSTAPTWTIGSNALNGTAIAFKDGAAAPSVARHQAIGGE